MPSPLGQHRDFSLKYAHVNDALRISSPANRASRDPKAGLAEPSVLPVARKRRISPERPQKGHGSPVNALYWHRHTTGAILSIRGEMKGKTAE